jgi:hypothetical protein
VLITTITLRKANNKVIHKITLFLNSFIVFKLKSKIIKKPRENVEIKKNLIGLTESISMYGAIATIESAAAYGAISLSGLPVVPDLTFTIISLFSI